MKTVFRDADRSDLEALCEIYEKPYGGYSTAEKFIEMYLDHYSVRTIESDGKIVGTLVWFPREDPRLGWAEILDVWIKDGYRRKGLGLKLVHEAIKDSKAHFKSKGHRLRCVILFTSAKNEPARKLYEKAGFRNVGYGGYISEEGTPELLYSLNF